MRRPWLGGASGVAMVVALTLPGMALAADDAATSTSQGAGPADTGQAVSEIVVTARRLNAARDAIQPQLGASVHTVDAKAIEAMPGGDDVALNQVVLQAPGVAQDSFGQLHVRGEHNGLQFRLNGVILPEGLSVFSQALSPRIADKVALITGALPAQYGLRTAGIVDITTKSDPAANAGSVSIYGGAHGEIEPSLEYGGSAGNVNFFTSLSYLHSDLGIESPDGTSTPLHDRTDQFQGFAYLEDIIDPSTRVSAILGASNERFQIPDESSAAAPPLFALANGQTLNVNGQTSFPAGALNDSQKEATYYGVISVLHTAGEFTGQLSVFGRYSTLYFIPDPVGDLLYTGISQAAGREDGAVGFQAEGVYHVGEAHTLRGGLIGQVDISTSQTTSQVIALEPDGSQASGPPLTIPDSGRRTAYTLSAYLQDEWKLASTLTFNYGLRFDEFDGYRDERQLSPRANLVWQAAPATTVHVGYARYFSPPPFELVGSRTVGLFNGTTAASQVTQDTTPYAERAHYFDLGVSQKVGRGLTVGIDSYYKYSRNLIDEGQFGAPIIETPFNYRIGEQYGVELSASYNQGPFSSYANLAIARNIGKDIVSSQFNFSPEDLAYIASHYIYLDHNQTYTASAGVSYLWRGTRMGADLIYGSGLRSTGADGVPNGDHLPGYAQVNLSLSHRFEKAPLGPLEARLDVTNVADRRYEIRDGTGVGVGAPQYGPRVGVFGGLTKSF